MGAPCSGRTLPERKQWIMTHIDPCNLCVHRYVAYTYMHACSTLILTELHGHRKHMNEN